MEYDGSEVTPLSTSSAANAEKGDGKTSPRAGDAGYRTEKGSRMGFAPLKPRIRQTAWSRVSRPPSGKPFLFPGHRAGAGGTNIAYLLGRVPTPFGWVPPHLWNLMQTLRLIRSRAF